VRCSCGRCLDEYVASDMVGITLAEIIDHTSFNLCPVTEALHADFSLISQFGVKDIKTIKKQIRYGFRLKHPSCRIHTHTNIFMSRSGPWDNFLVWYKNLILKIRISECITFGLYTNFRGLWREEAVRCGMLSKFVLRWWNFPFRISVRLSQSCVREFGVCPVRYERTLLQETLRYQVMKV